MRAAASLQVPFSFAGSFKLENPDAGHSAADDAISPSNEFFADHEPWAPKRIPGTPTRELFHRPDVILTGACSQTRGGAR